MAIPHLNALLLQLRCAFAGDVLANRFPRVVVTGENDREERDAERSTDRAAGGNMVEVLNPPQLLGT
jgi:hypothetical protein